MGVPGFFLWLMKNYKKNKFVNNINDFNKEIKWLCLDANCLLHPKCFEVLAENPNYTNLNNLENKMILRCLEYIEKLVGMVKPTEGLYIAIDGVAPAAKIKQQRSRRFKSVNDREMIEKLKMKHNKEITKFWNNSSITPGTDFMMKITKKIKEWSKNQNYKIIFSSANTPSEGEHKILDFIRKRQEQSREENPLNGPYIIYGLDADLIFLSLALGRNDIYLMREAKHLNKGDGDILQLVDLETMKESIVDTMNNILDDVINKPSENELINDFIFICYFLGNDFLPHYASLDIYEDGLPILLKTYCKTIESTILPILQIKNNELKFNQKTLVEFLKYLSEQEEEILNKLPGKNIKKPRLIGDDYEKELMRIENLCFKINDPINLGEDSYDEYSKRFYEYYFNDSCKNTILEICYEYLKGLAWVSKYYFIGVPSWDYYYPYDQAPFIKDLFKVINIIDINIFKFKQNKPLKPLEQLLAVLPPQSKYLVPKEMHFLYSESSNLGHLYPENFKQDFIHKRKYWQGIPLLPFLELDLIKEEFNKIEKKLNKLDLLKNKVTSEYEFN